MENRKEYDVVYPFRDLQNKSKRFPNGKEYAIGDIYFDKADSVERVQELSGKSNKIGKPLIKPKQAPKVEDDVLDYEGITKADIGNLLETRGIEYNPRDTKQELFDLLGSD